MQKVITSLSFVLFSLTAFADLSNRGRLDHEHGEFEFVIPLIGVIVLGGVFGYCFLKDFWCKHKENIHRLISLLVKGLMFVIGIGVVVGFLYDDGDNKSIKPQMNSNISMQSDANANMVQTENSLPEGSRPVTEQEDIANLGTTSSVQDPWAGYPPVIADGSQMTNKKNDFLLAAILNPSFNLHDYYCVLDMTPQNTQFLSYDRYCRSNFIRQHYTPSELQKLYTNVQRAWNVFCSLENTNFQSPEIIKYMIEYSLFDSSKPRIEDASNPQLIRNLKMKPLLGI